MSILKQKYLFANTAVNYLPKQLHHLFRFGFSSLALERITSLRGNARQVVANPHTAKTKAWRLLKNRHLLAALPRLLAHFNLVTSQTLIALDFSDFHGWQVLTFARQTRKGRAIPVYFEIIKYPVTEKSQNIFIVNTIEHFVALVGSRPKIVMDRGFACPYIIKHLAKHRHPFVARVKSIKVFRKLERKQRFKAKNTSLLDQWVIGYGNILRLVISDWQTGMKEPWFLITNDFDHSRDSVINNYYYRFEIEEFFKDAKWLLGLEHVRYLKMQSLAMVLWFVVLGLWVLHLAHLTDTQGTKKQHATISFTRSAYECLQRELRNAALAALGLNMDQILYGLRS